jgi:hypothetical protein
MFLDRRAAATGAATIITHVEDGAVVERVEGERVFGVDLHA